MLHYTCMLKCLSNKIIETNWLTNTTLSTSVYHTTSKRYTGSSSSAGSLARSTEFGRLLLQGRTGICLPSKPFTTSCSTRSWTKILLVLYKGQTTSKIHPTSQNGVWIADSFFADPCGNPLRSKLLGLNWSGIDVFCMFTFSYCVLWKKHTFEQAKSVHNLISGF